MSVFSSLHGVVPCMSLHWSGTTRLKFARAPLVSSAPSWVSGTMLARAVWVPVKFRNGLCFDAYSASVLLGHLNVYGPFAFGPVMTTPDEGVGGRFWK